MRHIKLIAWLSNLVLLALFLFCTPLHAQESFYRGKTLRFIVAYEPGAASTSIPAQLRATLANMSQEIPPLSWRI